jgi:hypothetical protein
MDSNLLGIDDINYFVKTWRETELNNTMKDTLDSLNGIERQNFIENYKFDDSTIKKFLEELRDNIKKWILIRLLKVGSRFLIAELIMIY